MVVLHLIPLHKLSISSCCYNFSICYRMDYTTSGSTAIYIAHEAIYLLLMLYLCFLAKAIYIEHKAIYLLLMLYCCFLTKSANINDLPDEEEGVKILWISKDILACSVVSNSCTTCKVRHACYLHYYQDSFAGDRVWHRVHILRMWCCLKSIKLVCVCVCVWMDGMCYEELTATWHHTTKR